MTTSIYPSSQHPVIDKARRQIRLLSAELGVDRKDGLPLLKCKTAVFELSHTPKYTALSYCWGSESCVSSIVLNTKSFKIRNNLNAFLLTWCNKSERLNEYLWIDQLCIDQENIAERSHQVQFMGLIYALAEQTICWLGEDDGLREDDYVEAIQFWERYCWNHPENAIPWADYHWHRWFAATTAIAEYVEVHFPIQHTTTNSDKIWSRNLCRNLKWWYWVRSCTYWTRLWIVQEICLSSQVLLWLGHHVVTWELFCMGMKTLNQLHHSLDHPATDLRFFEWLLSCQENIKRDLGRSPESKWVFFDSSESRVAYQARKRSKLQKPYKRGAQQEHTYGLGLKLAPESIGAFDQSKLYLAITSTLKQSCQNDLDIVFALGHLVPARQRLMVDYSMTKERLFYLVVNKLISTSIVPSWRIEEVMAFCVILFKRLKLHNQGIGYTVYVPVHDHQNFDGIKALCFFVLKPNYVSTSYANELTKNAMAKLGDIVKEKRQQSGNEFKRFLKKSRLWSDLWFGF